VLCRLKAEITKAVVLLIGAPSGKQNPASAPGRARLVTTELSAGACLRRLGGQRSRSPVERSLVQHVDYVS
jgi:hypothetical protein